MNTRIPVYLELGQKRVFACSLDWPGWCRSGKDEEQALASLAASAPRYDMVAVEAGVAFPFSIAPSFEVLERLPGSATTDFGAPGKAAAGDRLPWSAEEAERILLLLEASWRVFDRVVSRAPAELKKGLRGGGRDRDAIVEHVLAAESAYARAIGVRLQPDPGDAPTVADNRQAVLDGLRWKNETVPVPETGWPPRYAARRIAWHVLDHAWEIEDRTPR